MAKKEKYYKRKDGLYEAIRTINGKRVAFRGKTCREVDRKMLEYKEKAERGRTVEEVAEEWLESRSNSLSESSLVAYKGAMPHVLDALGGMFVKEVKPINCLRLMESMAGRGYKLGTVRVVHTMMRQIFRHAVIHGDIDVSPAAEVVLPRGLARTKREALTAEQIKAVTECREGKYWLLGLAFLWTGCRRGELMALRYEDIDRKAKTITINKKYNYTGNRAKLEDHTKTEAGMRTIPLLPPLADALPRNRIGLIFCNDNGDPLHRWQLDAAWAEYRKTIGLADHITPHYFRHTFATICYNAGADAKETAAIMGHSSEAITMELYTHLTNEKRAQAVQKLEEYAASAV